MKTYIKSFQALFLFVFLFSGDINGQADLRSSAFHSPFAYGDELANGSGDGSLVKSRVSQPALLAFANSFKDISNVKWYRLGKFYLVYFFKNSNNNKALYDAKGHLQYCISYGTEKNLPARIRKMVKREYVEFNILQAVEVNEERRNIWVINVSDDDYLITVRVENGNIEEVHRYTKAPANSTSHSF